MARTFNTDRFFFGRYYLLNISIYGTLSALIAYFGSSLSGTSPLWVLVIVPLFLTRFRYIMFGAVTTAGFALWSYAHELTWWLSVGFAGALYVGHLTASVIHNAAHRNFHPKWLNSVLGEACALQQLSAGLVVFRFIHSQHHAYPDDPIRDPHPPRGLSFWQFVDAARSLVAARLEAIYLERWGDSQGSRRLWGQQNALLIIARFTKTMFWFALLGPKLFALIYVPSYISNVFIFAAFNYYSHKEGSDGEMEIRDLSGSGYFDLCNRLFQGVMFHRTHHETPRQINPMAYAKSSEAAS